MHTHTGTALRVLDLQALFTGSDNMDVLAGSTGSLLAGKLSAQCSAKESERLGLGQGNCFSQRLLKTFENTLTSIVLLFFLCSEFEKSLLIYHHSIVGS